MAYTFHDCSVESVTQETEHVRRFRIRWPEELSKSFRAGQFVLLNLPIESRVTTRSYSIASPPQLEGFFDLIISRNPTGLGSTYLFEQVQPGSIVQVSHVLGKFLLPDPIDDDICFICTGTGLAPFRSQLLDIFHRGIPHRRLILIFGNRFERDILYRQELEDLAKEYDTLTFIPVLSRDNPGWTGRNGYVHAVYEELFADRRPAWFYICGWADMLREARQRIAAMGYDKSRIRFESYD